MALFVCYSKEVALFFCEHLSYDIDEAEVEIYKILDLIEASVNAKNFNAHLAVHQLIQIERRTLAKLRAAFIKQFGGNPLNDSADSVESWGLIDNIENDLG